MDIVFCRDDAEFMEKYGDILTAHDEELQLFSVNLCGGTGERGGVYDRGELKTIFLNAMPYNLQLFEVKRSVESVYRLAEYYADTGIKIRGLQGAGHTCDAFAKRYRELTGKAMFKFFDMTIMTLAGEPRITAQPGALYRAQPTDLETLSGFMVAFSAQAMCEKLDSAAAKERTMSLIDAGQLYMYSVNGRPVGMISHARRCKSGETVTMVYIDECARGRGYAKGMVYAMAKRLLEKDARISLFVEKGNAAANKVYADVGFKYTADNCDYRVL